MSSKVFDRDHVHRGSVTALNFAQGLSLKRASINAGAVSAKLPAAVRSVEDLLRRNADAKRILSGEKQLEKRSAWHRVRDATDVGIPDVDLRIFAMQLQHFLDRLMQSARPLDGGEIVDFFVCLLPRVVDVHSVN